MGRRKKKKEQEGGAANESKIDPAAARDSYRTA